MSKFRIDLGVVHPDAPGRFLAGVECDGASYHSSPTARDRDRVRQIILENLGWHLFRIWSTDYFVDPKAAIDRLDNNLTELLERDRSQPAEEVTDAPDLPEVDTWDDEGGGQRLLPETDAPSIEMFPIADSIRRIVPRPKVDEFLTPPTGFVERDESLADWRAESVAERQASSATSSM